MVRVPLIAILALAFAGQAAAQSSWRFEATPYLWGPGIDGNVQRTQGSLHFDRSLDALFDELNAAFLVTGTARRGRLVVLADFSYSDVSEQRDTTPPSRPNIRVAPSSTELRLRMIAATLVAGYAVVDRPEGSLDLVAGVRAFGLTADLETSSPLPALNRARRESGNWAGPVVGLRGRYQLTPAWSVIGYADYGGFGVDFGATWQAAATMSYRIGERWALSGGYRLLAFDRRGGDRDFDIRTGGPLIGATLRF